MKRPSHNRHLKFLFIAGLFLFAIKTNIHGQNLKDTSSLDTTKIEKIILKPASSNKDVYCNLLCLGIGDLMSPTNYNSLKISFPYTATDKLGNTSQKQFISNSINPVQKNQPFFSLSLELGNLKHSGNINLLLNDRLCIGFGYGYNFYLSPFQKTNVTKEKEIIIQPSINFCFSELERGGGNNYLGLINNENMDLNVLGFKANSSYTIATGKKKGYDMTTYNAKTLNIYYSQNVWTVLPKISFRNNQYKHRFHYEFNIGYYIPISKKEGIALYQDNTNSIAPQKILNFNQSTLITSYNNKIVTSTPYTFSGLYIGFGIGLTLSFKNLH